MQETIKSLWNGLYKPANIDVEHCKHEKELLETICKYETELKDMIHNEKMALLFERYMAAQMLCHGYQLEAAFAKGFSIGVKLTYEAASPKLELS